jgi:pyruvate/2-oxoglutarate dehydrogenase complex dihydrolipoamide acyltransferase (E2) component
MPRIYENAKTNFSSFEEFKEIGVKTIQEIYGRVRPLDVFDFSQNETHYKVVGYYDGEVIPEEQAEGEVQSDAAAEAERIAREQDEANRLAAEQEAHEARIRIQAIIDAGEELTDEDAAIATNLGIELPKKELTEEQAAELEAKVKSGHISYEAAEALGLKTIDGVAIADARKAARGDLQGDVAAANGEAATTKDLPYGVKEHDGKLISDAALELALEKGVDIKKIDGTGRDGVIKKSDVADYIKNHAPAQENANGNDTKQPNA